MVSTHLPEELQSLLQRFLAEMNNSSQHRLTPWHRRILYDTLLASARPQAMGWLAIITAQRVLPLFEREFPDDTLPQDLLDAAIGVMENRINNAAADGLLEEGYHASGNAWGYEETEITWNADLAGRAAYLALKEARRQVPPEHLDKYFKFEVADAVSGDSNREEHHPIRADQVTDEYLCQIEISDTAAAAVVAFACEPDSPICDTAKFQEFWKWWLTAAIPEAWKRAGQGLRSTGHI